MITPLKALVSAVMAVLVVGVGTVSAADAPPVPTVHFVWMGGPDCPPCVGWRLFELPKLQKTAEFQAIKYHYVTKSISASVPPAFFMPDELRPFKNKLDKASGGGFGSPQAALIVDGEVYDYFWGVRTAEEIEMMLKAVRTGSAYPFRRCVKMSRMGRACEIYVSQEEHATK